MVYNFSKNEKLKNNLIFVKRRGIILQKFFDNKIFLILFVIRIVYRTIKKSLSYVMIIILAERKLNLLILFQKKTMCSRNEDLKKKGLRQHVLFNFTFNFL